jgi:hypothetical protein
MNQEHKCSTCSSSSPQWKCSSCILQTTAYCGKGCHVKHWPTHRQDEHLVDEIVPGVWLGGLNALFTHPFVALVSALPPTVVYHLSVPIADADDAPIERYFERCSSFLTLHEWNDSPILIHCSAGHSRSVVLLAHWLMRRNKWTREEALRFIQSKRVSANPTESLVKKL